ncbi:hypothetical protein LMG23992_04249 [Cupriavidus laharis]|uniref:Uncharacterized protein n=1 Tax=Cupriavidus laharis TaxID=151654 RepID=A0ABN7Z802_9BURK|nr:hypothetical protein [Cupriavidus laharis]CAG9180466.1 hypothetical protein LMG23992_04249 [Cupriavidus laharis]
MQTISPITTEGKTVQEVSDLLALTLRAIELEPEWIIPTNFLADADEAQYGLRPTAPWPAEHARHRFAVSVERGMSEGWRVHVDHIATIVEGPSSSTTLRKLVSAKMFNREQAWQTARAINRALDLD